MHAHTNTRIHHRNWKENLLNIEKCSPSEGNTKQRAIKKDIHKINYDNRSTTDFVYQVATG